MVERLTDHLRRYVTLSKSTVVESKNRDRISDPLIEMLRERAQAVNVELQELLMQHGERCAAEG